MRSSVILSLAAANAVSAFPWVASQPGVDNSLLRRQQDGTGQAGGPDTCPFNANHVNAPLVTDEYPYNAARNGLPGKGEGGFLVPATGDTVHQFIAPDYSKDIRGPCPGLNTAANHGFLARDGITTFNELVDAQQNLYNVGWDLAVLLATLGLSSDGDIASQRLSIGCDATTRTSSAPVLTGSQPGLVGHNKFEADTSLTRNDYFTHNGDNFNFNGTLFKYMTETTGGIYDLNGLALYRRQRWDQSIVENPNFYFGPFSLLLFGAASFLYELFPSGPNYVPDFPTISSFFGAESDGNGGYRFNGQERIPDNWTNRKEPYSIFAVGSEIFKMYGLQPVPFGGNTGNGQYDFINWGGSIKDGYFTSPPSPASVSCLLYQIATERLPSSLNGFTTPTVEGLAFALTKLNPIFKNLGCPLKLT